MAMIAERANVGAGTIYRYFESKDVLITELYRDLEQRMYPFILDGVIGQPKLIQGDHIHPDIAGVTVIADRLAPVLAGEMKPPA